jgi:hypothetical protein
MQPAWQCAAGAGKVLTVSADVTATHEAAAMRRTCWHMQSSCSNQRQAISSQCLIRQINLLLLSLNIFAAAFAPCLLAVGFSAVLPNGAVTGLDIGFSNASLVHITMSFYTMCKSTTPIFLLAFAFMWRLET